jgi:hypothetical protein
MAGTTIEGRYCKVTIGTTNVLGIGNWEYAPGEAADLDDSEFGDSAQKVLAGMMGFGTVSFKGRAKIGDTTGQEALKKAQINGTNLTTLRLYENNTSYYTPNATTGYMSPSSTSANQTILSYLTVKSFRIGVAKDGLADIDFTCRVSGQMVEV